MTSFEISTYTDRDQITFDTAQQVSNLFAFNYPTSHSEEDREYDIIGKLNADVVMSSLDRGNTLYVASEDTTVAGFLESRTRDQSHRTYEQLAWIMTAAEYRGRHLASLLHGFFIDDATQRALERVPKPTLAVLSVHENNPAKAIYERWGYSVVDTTDEDKLLMTMRLP